MIAITQSLLVFWQFFCRRLQIKKKMFFDNAINYALIYPTVFAIQTGYLQATSYFGKSDPKMNTILFAGTILLIMMLFTYKQNIELLFDLEHDRFIDYQITLLNPFFALFERILFTGLYTFFITLPFYPIAGLLIPLQLDLSHAHWAKVVIILFSSSMCLSAYHLLAACALQGSAHIGSLWNRANNVMMTLGGFWIPWYVMNNYSPILGYITYLNPAIYITEGLKGSVTGSPEFLPFELCVTMLWVWFILLTALCWYFFKKRVDCI
jgi:hypothetical protein